MESIKTRIRGTRPLIQHNGQLADPLNEYAKALKVISGKRGKTESDFQEMARIEYLGGLYLNDKDEVILPSEMIEACIIAGAKKTKCGLKAKSGVIVPMHSLLVYDGPPKSEELLQDEKFVLRKSVKVQQNRIMRTRPIFPVWAADIVIHFDELIADREAVLGWLKAAGNQCGLGDWRPKFGLFEVVE